MSESFRNYKYTTDMVELTYKKNYTNQTLSYVLNFKKKYILFPNISIKLWNALVLLNTIIDESDPDSKIEQINHAYQTSESIIRRYFNNRINLTLNNNIKIVNLFSDSELKSIPNKYKHIYEKNTIKSMYNMDVWSWLPLIGLIHDLGKLLILDDFGKLPQWSVVGDTYPVGCSIEKGVIFSDKQFYKENKEYQKYNTKYGIYKKNCGFAKLNFTWGHDEYLYMVLKKNSNKLPKEGLYMIRYHSFYAWHTPQKNKTISYSHFASDYDWKMLPLLKILQKSDLYSKNPNLPPIKELELYYKNLINKYFKETVLF